METEKPHSPAEIRVAIANKDQQHYPCLPSGGEHTVHNRIAGVLRGQDEHVPCRGYEILCYKELPLSFLTLSLHFIISIF